VRRRTFLTSVSGLAATGAAMPAAGSPPAGIIVLLRGRHAFDIRPLAWRRGSSVHSAASAVTGRFPPRACDQCGRPVARVRRKKSLNALRTSPAHSR
jgi:hypothetical protein